MSSNLTASAKYNYGSMMEITADIKTFIDNLIAKQLLRPEAYTQVAEKMEENTKLRKEVMELKTEIANLRAEHAKVKTDLYHATAAHETAEKAFKDASDKFRAGELTAAVAQAKSETIKECFGLVFRNQIIRERSFGNESAGIAPASQYNTYPQVMVAPYDRSSEKTQE